MTDPTPVRSTMMSVLEPHVMSAAVLVPFTGSSSQGVHLEHVVAPWRECEIQPLRDEVIPVPVEGGRAHQILEPHGATGLVGERETDVALALVPCIVDGGQSPLALASLPAPCDEAVRRPVAIPCPHAVEQAPLAVSNGRLSEYREEAVVEPLPCLIEGLYRRPHQVRRDALHPPLELPLMEESQDRGQERDDGGGLVRPGREGRGGPGLVVVLEESGEL